MMFTSIAFRKQRQQKTRSESLREFSERKKDFLLFDVAQNISVYSNAISWFQLIFQRLLFLFIRFLCVLPFVCDSQRILNLCLKHYLFFRLSNFFFVQGDMKHQLIQIRCVRDEQIGREIPFPSQNVLVSDTRQKIEMNRKNAN